MTSFSKRRNLFEKGEWEWRITDDAMVARDHKGREDVGPWREVTALRLGYEPTQYKTWRHVIELKFRNGAKWTIDNVHFAGVGEFENRSATYAPFVREAVAKVRELAPRAKGRVGSAPVFYWTSVIVLGLLFAVLAVILLLVPVAEFPGVVWAKLGIIALFLPTLLLWARKSFPRGMALEHIPEDALP